MPAIDVHQAPEAAHEQRGADEQHHRERELDDDERGSHRLLRRRRRRRARPSSAPWTSGFENCHAGTRPKRMPVRRRHDGGEHQHAAVDADFVHPRQSAGASARIRSFAQTRQQQRRRRRRRTRRSRLSVSSSRASRARPAPSARRMPSSRCRAAPRASSRLAMFAHAISSTTPTAPSITISAVRRLPDEILVQRDQARRPAGARRVVVGILGAQLRARTRRAAAAPRSTREARLQPRDRARSARYAARDFSSGWNGAAR